jgi:superfamily II DNA or RNA helicase
MELIRYIPRPYQKQIIADCRQHFINGKRAVMIALATGGGKTVIIAEIIRMAKERGRTIIFIVDRVQLVRQAVETFQGIGADVGVLQGENSRISPANDVVVATVQTARSRGASMAALMVIDEAHILHKTHIELITGWKDVPVIGLSATPLREDLGKYFDALIRGPSIEELTEQGYLVPARAFCPSAETIKAMLAEIAVSKGDYAEGELSKTFNQKIIVGNLVNSWQQRAENRPTLVFAIDIAHSKSIRDDFLSRGIKAAHLDYKTPFEEREQLIAEFKAGRIEVLTSVAVLGIGFDAPNASCAILARPTLSESLHMQQIGRVLRPDPDSGKQDALILDHAGNTLRFGMPEDFTVPELGDAAYKQASKKRKKTDKLTECRECSAVLRPDAARCHECGTDRPQRSTDVIYADADLIKRGSKGTGKPVYSIEEIGQWYKALLWQCRHSKKPKADGCAYHMLLARFPDWPVDELNTLSRVWKEEGPIPPSLEQRKWVKHYWIKRFKQRERQETA